MIFDSFFEMILLTKFFQTLQGLFGGLSKALCDLTKNGPILSTTLSTFT